MTTRRIGLRRWIGHNGSSAMIAAQFGLAMIPLWRAISSGLISGTTSGTAGSMRNAEELSMTTAPFRAAIGAYSRAVLLPAENSAKSTPSKLSALSASTVRSRPQHGSTLPADRGEA
jgi:hypothetical protein